MFGHRPDGKRLKSISPYTKIIPHIMKARHDAQNIHKVQVDCKYLDEFVKKVREETGVVYSYMDILFAATVRMFALRPYINRFVVNGRIYKRHKIQLAFVIKRGLTDESVDTTVKLTFDGTESIEEVKKMIEDIVRENKVATQKNGTDTLMKIFTSGPNTIVKAGIGLLKWADKHGLIPGSVLKNSPFHSSAFVTNLKSIKCDYVYHHLYDFGTTSLFLAMGKESMQPVVSTTGEIVPAKIMNIGVNMDERTTDGLYWANSLRLFQSFMRNPYVLTKKLDPSEVKKDVD
ncbi:MAG: 2-oxoglutarate dehydrogenase [Clostridia bacterium]|nr:2-oxoglutarate dehydrogenase [Clostridia bacterium]